MKRVVIDRFGGPEVVSVVEEGDPRPGRGEVRARVLASGISLSDAQMRAGTYLGGPKPPFTPGYELVGVVDELGPGCSRLCVGDRVEALTQWGAKAESVCVPEKYAVEVGLHAKVADALVHGAGGGDADWRLVAAHYDRADRFDEGPRPLRGLTDRSARSARDSSASCSSADA